MNSHLFPYQWYLKDGYPKANGLNVFGTFICGGGSTMGYKLAGYNHLGGVEIDKQLSDVYKINHNPKYLYSEDIRTFNKRNDLPDELYNLDILDGSPPCSTFSMAGSREKAWGKNKKFREGQTKQVLDDLVFIYCDTIIKLQPKVFILENVKGIIQGNAKSYSKAIVKKMVNAGYNVQVFSLNAATMGVPQRRERVFFIGSKKELDYPKLEMKFNENSILFWEIKKTGEKIGINGQRGVLWDKAKQGENFSKITKNRNFSSMRLSDNKVCNTLTANSCEGYFHSTEKRPLIKNELCKIGSYPLDYDFMVLRPMYLIGMSVPPVMTAQIATQIKKQWLS